MTDIISYIDAHLQEPLSVQRLADAAGYSKSHFLRLFKAKTGMTCMNYVWKRRLLAAANDISCGDSIINAAIGYGWNSQSAFTKAFKREFGYSPSILRAAELSIRYMEEFSMKNQTIERTKIGLPKEKLFQLLQASLRKHHISVKEEDLKQTYNYACEVYKDKCRNSGEEYVTHPLNVSLILSEMEADPSVILAGMFCDANKKVGLHMDQCKDRLPCDVFRTVSDLAASDGKDPEGLSEDIALIKLAERLHNMQTIGYIDAGRQKEKALETIRFFVPLAQKFGCTQMADRLETLSKDFTV